MVKMVKPVTNVKYLDEIITARGTNKRDLARTMGMSYDGLCRKMKGKARFTLQDSLNIAMALELQPWDFVNIFFFDSFDDLSCAWNGLCCIKNNCLEPYPNDVTGLTERFEKE